MNEEELDIWLQEMNDEEFTASQREYIDRKCDELKAYITLVVLRGQNS